MQKTGKGYIPIPVLGFIGLIRLQKYFHNPDFAGGIREEKFFERIVHA